MLNGLFAIAAVAILGLVLATLGAIIAKLWQAFTDWRDGIHATRKAADYDRRHMRLY